MLVQEAPYPDELEDLVKRLQYRPGWTFKLEEMERDTGCFGLTLIITTLGYNSYHPEQGPNYSVRHLFPVPPATYNRRSWRRWLFDQCQKVDRHEAMEFFMIDDERPYAPNHGPGNDPYIVAELSTDLDRRTLFTGKVKES